MQAHGSHLVIAIRVGTRNDGTVVSERIYSITPDEGQSGMEAFMSMPLPTGDWFGFYLGSWGSKSLHYRGVEGQPSSLSETVVLGYN